MDKQINRGISESFRNGILTSVSLVANGNAFLEALDEIKKHPGISAGVHLCLVGEKALLPREKVPSIVDGDGFLAKDFLHLLCKIYSGKADLSEVRNELRAQIEMVLDNGITPTHLDSHQYTHVIPAVFNIVLSLARQYNIKWIRHPYRFGAITRVSLKAHAKKIYFSLFCARQHTALLKNGIACADFSCGILSSGCLNEESARDILEGMRPGFTDITCHPGYAPEDKRYRAWDYHWEDELRLLVSGETRALAERLNIKLVNYAD